MTNLLIQIWAALFYLLNKFFFLKSETASDRRYQRQWRIWAWICYLIGLPPWVMVFITEHNWIAAAVEASGAPAMFLGLSAAFFGYHTIRRYLWLDHAAKLTVVFGLGLSLYDFHGLTTVNQVLELGIAAGFLLGTYFAAKSNPHGYFWFMEGNICAALLMMRQGYFLIMAQQVLSLILVSMAWLVQRRKRQKWEREIT